jgi:hypothetical protein
MILGIGQEQRSLGTEFDGQKAIASLGDLHRQQGRRQITCHFVKPAGARLALRRHLGVLLVARGELAGDQATMSITAKVIRYCASLTAKEKRGGTKKKSKAATARKELATAGPRPRRMATMSTASRNNMAMLVSSIAPASGVARASGQSTDGRCLEIGQPLAGAVAPSPGTAARVVVACHLHHVEVGRGMADAVGHRAVPGSPAARMVTPDQHPRQVLLARIVDDRRDRIVSRKGRRFSAERAGKIERAHDALPLQLGLRPRGVRVDVNGMPGRLQSPGQTRTGAHQSLAARARSDAHQQRVARLPYRIHRGFAAVGQHLVVDAVGSAAQANSRRAIRLPLRKKLRIARSACCGR